MSNFRTAFLSASFLALLSLTTACHAKQSVAEPKTAAPSGYALVWSDEFSGSGLPDPKKWSYDTRGNKYLWWHNERQYYSTGRPENARVEGGHLNIEVRKEALAESKDWMGQEFSSVRLTTARKAAWQYGFFDVRAKLACGRGVWPAIWLLSDTGQWPQDGEIDIMEQVGHEPGKIHSTLHSSTKELMNGVENVADTCGSYHNYQLDWRKDSMAFMVDGRPIYTVKKGDRGYDSWPFDHKFYLLLNVAVGGAWGAQKGIDVDAFPSQMDVDYVRVYQSK
jgi:beta-glucanase (GH16 family)